MKYTSLLFAIFLSFQLSAQKIITGRVTKAGGGVLSGVKIEAKDAPMIFTLSDEYGNYKLEIPEEVTSLVFSFSGMTTKTIKIKDFIAINVKLVPSKYKPFRYGMGIAFGTSNFEVYQNNYRDTTRIKLTPVSVHGDLFYRISKNFVLQGVFEDGLNYTKYPADSINSLGDTVHYEETTGVNRFNFSLLLNYHIKLNKIGSHSLSTGFGPQYQYLSFLKTNTIGARFQLGVNINNYGKTTKLYLAVDIANGKFSKNSTFVPNFPYTYFSSRFGVTFIF